jgi:endonuclease YncB( thermonuclease family)
MATPVHIYRAVVVRVIDGDTLVVTVDLGFRISTTVHVRVRGLHAPELTTPEGKAVAAHVTSLLAQRPNVLVQTFKDRQSFSRWVADVWLDDGVSFAEWAARPLEQSLADRK